MVIEVDDISEFLEHHGVKGMRWGVRKGPREISRRTDKAAAKDAKEFARAKMFFGEGAGTRRKLIRESVDAKSKRDPAFAKAFQAHLEKQDLSKHASKAVSERKGIDRKTKVKRSAGFLARKFTGEMGTTAAFTAVALAGAAFLNTQKGRSMMSKGFSKTSNTMSNARDEVKRRNGARKIKQMFNQ